MLAWLLDKAGKTAEAKESPTKPIGTQYKLYERLKILMEPTVSVEAMAVIIIKLIW